MTQADVDRFREIVTRLTGLSLDGTPPTELADLLAKRVADSGEPSAAYLDRLATDRNADELAALVPFLTVPETYFFRHADQLRALVDVAVPALTGAPSGRPLRLLSVGCATGEEAYTLAMVVRDAAGHLPFSVTGVDVNPVALRRAERGRYTQWSLRATPAMARHRWFRDDGDAVVVVPEIRDLVRFVPGNLAAPDATWLVPGGYDVVFCRNVVMYLTPVHIADAVTRLADALVPGGFLFLGHAEISHGRRDGLVLRYSHDTFYYQRTVAGAPDVAAVPPATPPAGGDPRPAPAPAPTVPVPARRTADRPTDPPATARAVTLLRQDRYADALAAVAAETGPEAELLRAVLLTDLGRLDEAEQACQRLLDTDGLHAGAHYLLAVCRETSGDLAGARYHCRTAAYLDPGFAMPRLRAGQLSRRHGDTATARRELAAALALLPGESDRALLLYGAGFTRAALVAVCRTELTACGAGP